MIVLFSVLFFQSLLSGTNLRWRIVTLHVRVSQRSIIRDRQQKIAGKMSGSKQSRQVCNGRFIACLQQKRGRIGLFYLVIIR